MQGNKSILFLKKLQVHILVEVVVREDELDSAAQLHTWRHPADARTVARELNHTGATSNEAVGDDAHAAKRPDSLAEW